MQQSRTSCKYGDCNLEKLELEFNILNNLRTKLEKNRVTPEDWEDLYRVYPLLDTTAALLRKTLVCNGSKNKNYTVKTVKPSNQNKKDTSKYLFCDEKRLFNGNKETVLLADIVSTILHTNSYVYIDTRKTLKDKEFIIYVYLRTDELCNSCSLANLENPNINGKNYRNSIGFIKYDDCICGRYLDVRSHIDSIQKLIQNRIDNFTKKSNKK